MVKKPTERKTVHALADWFEPPRAASSSRLHRVYAVDCDGDFGQLLDVEDWEENQT